MLKDLMIGGQKIGQVEVPDGMRVEYRHPKAGEDFIDSTEPESGVKRASFSFSVNHHFVLVPIPPQMVPLGPEDVVPGKTLIRRTSIAKDVETLVFSKSSKGVALCAHLEDEAREPSLYFIAWQQLRTGGTEFSNDHGITWQKCEKPSAP